MPTACDQISGTKRPCGPFSYLDTFLRKSTQTAPGEFQEGDSSPTRPPGSPPPSHLGQKYLFWTVPSGPKSSGRQAVSVAVESCHAP